MKYPWIEEVEKLRAENEKLKKEGIPNGEYWFWLLAKFIGCGNICFLCHYVHYINNTGI